MSFKRLMTWRHFNEQNYILSNPFSLPKGPQTEFDTAVRLVEVTIWQRVIICLSYLPFPMDSEHLL